MGTLGAVSERSYVEENDRERARMRTLVERLSDDDLLFEIERLPAGHDADADLLKVVRSARHFFIRQEAAKKVRNHEQLKDHSTDRHIGQILVRGLNRSDDVAYLERLLVESRHIEVKKAAEAQLRAIATAKTVPRIPKLR